MLAYLPSPVEGADRSERNERNERSEFAGLFFVFELFISNFFPGLAASMVTGAVKFHYLRTVSGL